MHHVKHLALVLLGALAVLFAALAYRESSRVFVELRNHSDEIAIVLEGQLMCDSYTDSWWCVVEGGYVYKTVTTVCKCNDDPPETEEECEKRHANKVARAQKQCPPVTPP